MALEKKSGLFYEILIRGVCTADPERKLGELAGAHYIEGEAVVDTDTGELIQYKPGVAQELPADKVAAWLGDRFVAFEAQLRNMEAERDAAMRAAEQIDTAAIARDAAKDAEIEGWKGSYKAIEVSYEQKLIELASARDRQISELQHRIEQLTSAQADLDTRNKAALAALTAAPAQVTA